jgi:hypothetical protein
MALKMRERKRVAKKSLDQTLPFSAFSSRTVFGIPWRSKIELIRYEKKKLGPDLALLCLQLTDSFRDTLAVKNRTN